MTRRRFAEEDDAEQILKVLRSTDRDALNGKEFTKDFHFRYGDDGWSKLKLTVKLLIGSEESRTNLQAPSAIREDDREAAFEAITGLALGTVGESQLGQQDWPYPGTTQNYIDKHILPTFAELAGTLLCDFIRTLDRYAPAVYAKLPYKDERHIRILLGRPFGADASIQAYVHDRESYIGEPPSESLEHVTSQTGSYSTTEQKVWTAHIFFPTVLFAKPEKQQGESGYKSPFGWGEKESVSTEKRFLYLTESDVTADMRIDLVQFAGWLRTFLHEVTHKLTGDWTKATKLYTEGLVEYVLWKVATVRLDELERMPKDLTSADGSEVVLTPQLRRTLRFIYTYMLREATNDYGPLLAYWKDWERLQPWFGMEVVARGRAFLKSFEPTQADREAGRVSIVRFVRRILTTEGNLEYKDVPSFAPIMSEKYLFDVGSSVVIQKALAVEAAAERGAGVQSILKEVLRAFRSALKTSRTNLQAEFKRVQGEVAARKARGRRATIEAHEAHRWAQSVAEAETMALIAEHVFVPLAKFDLLISDYGGDIGAVPPKELRKVTGILGEAAPAFGQLMRDKVKTLADRTIVREPVEVAKGASPETQRRMENEALLPALLPDTQPVNNYAMFFDSIQRLEALKASDAASAFVDSYIEALGAYLQVERYKEAVRKLARAGVAAKAYVAGEGRGEYPSTDIGQGQDALQTLGASDEQGYLSVGFWDAYSHLFSEATLLYLSRRSFDQRLADDLEKLNNLDTHDWLSTIKRLGDTLSAHFRTLPPSKARQVVASARSAQGAFNLQASSKRFLNYGFDPGHIMVTTFKPLLRTVHLACLLDLSWSMKGSSVNREAMRMGTVYMLARGGKRGVMGQSRYHALALKRVSLGITLAAATIAGVLRDSKSVTAVFFSETAKAIPVAGIEDFLIRARFMEQKYVTAYVQSESALRQKRKILEDFTAPGVFDKTRAKKMRELKKDYGWRDDAQTFIQKSISAWEGEWREGIKRLQEQKESAISDALKQYAMPKDLQSIFEIEGEGARLDLAMRELEATGFYGRKGTKLVFIFTDGSPEAGDRNPLMDAPIQAEVVRQLTVYRNDAIFVVVFITPEDTEYQEVFDGKTMEFPRSEPHIGAGPDVLIYDGSVGVGEESKKVREVHYAKPPYYPPTEFGDKAKFERDDVRTVLEKQLGLRAVKFRVMSTPEWVKRLELGRVITVNLTAHEGWKSAAEAGFGGVDRDSIGVDIEQAFGDFTLAVDRAVREAVAMRMV